MPSTLDYVLKYADLGWASFPLRGKMPLPRCESCRDAGCRDIDRCGHRLCHGFRGATTDPDVLREWFADSSHNVGLAVPEGHVILDVDPRHHGDDTLNQIRDLLPRTTLVSESGRGDGGKHLWFVGDVDPVSLAGIDVKRAGKGYVLVEPSIHPETGGMYRWVNWGTSIARVPRTLPSIAPEGKPAQSLAQQLGISEGKRELFEAVLHGQTIYEGTQHDTVRDLAAYIAQRYGEFDGRPLFELCLSRCEIPHPEDDAERSWESAVQKFARDIDTTDPDEEDDDGDADEDAAPTRFDLDVQRALHDMRVREEARRQFAQQTQTWEPIELRTLDQILANPSTDPPFLIHGLWPRKGVVVFAAQAKAGKTTLVNNLVKSLVDGQPFLGHFEVQPLQGRVAVINTEVSEEQISGWYDDIRIDNQGAVVLVSIRGRLGWFDVQTESIRARLARAFRSLNVQVLIVDPVGPLWDDAMIDEDKSSQVGPWLVALNELAAQADISELMVVHHFGHATNRVRGASKLLGSNDAIWSMMCDAEPTKTSVEEVLGSPEDMTDDGRDRYFEARGRGVGVRKTMLSYDPKTRVISLDPHGIANRKAAQHAMQDEKKREEIRVYVRDHPGCSRGDLAGVETNNSKRSKYVKALTESGVLVEPTSGKLFVVEEVPNADT